MKDLGGIYRATCINDKDPLNQNRIYVSVLDVPGTTGWALPCVPFVSAGQSVTVPPPTTDIWVMFEDGNAMQPVWLGCLPG